VQARRERREADQRSARAERTQRTRAEYESDALLYSKSVYYSPKECLAL
jgi:hypothetical protein